MNREILFRGQNIHKQWLEGYYLRSSEGNHYIFALGDTVTYAAKNQVDSATVGQFTGLYDVNKKRIFEGDVVRWINKTCKVIEKDACCFAISESNAHWIHYLYDQSEVIGNIHDNPELMEVKGE